MHDKLEKLDRIIKKYMPLVIAFSGGVDSTFLLKRATMIDKDKVLAINIESDIMSSFEIKESIEFLKSNNIKHMILKKDPFIIKEFVENPKDKCYFCKSQVFKMILDAGKSKGYDFVADGSNASDINDYRPGMKALSELGIVSPLKEAGLTKGDIRKFSKEMGLETWDKPSNACLATRIATGIPISKDILEMIDEGEEYIRSFGIKQVRVRVHERKLARIEVDDFGMEILKKDGYYRLIVNKLKKIGFKYITLDLEGYITSGLRE